MNIIGTDISPQAN